MSLFDVTSPFETLDVTRDQWEGDQSLLATFDPLRARQAPQGQLAAPLSPFSAALAGHPVHKESSQLFPSPTRAGLLVDIGSTPTRATPKRKLFDIEATPPGSPLARTPKTAKRANDTPTKRPPLLSLRSPTGQLTPRSSPSRVKRAVSNTNGSGIYLDPGNTTTLPSFNLDASLLLEESGAFLAEQTLTDGFSKLFLMAQEQPRGMEKKPTADETLSEDWFRGKDATATALMDESTLMMGNVTLTGEILASAPHLGHQPDPSPEGSVAPTPQHLAPISRVQQSNSRSHAPQPTSSRSPSKVRESPLKHMHLQSQAGRSAAAGALGNLTAPPRQPIFAAAAAPVARRHGGLEQPKPARPAPVPFAKQSTKSGLAPPNSIKKSRSSTTIAVRTSVMPRPASAMAAPRPSSAFGGSRPGGPRISAIPALAPTTGPKSLHLPSARAPVSAPMVREISRPVAPARPLSIQGAAHLKRSLGPARSEPMAPPRLPRSQSDATLLGIQARAPTTRPAGYRNSMIGERPVRRA